MYVVFTMKPARIGAPYLGCSADARLSAAGSVSVANPIERIVCGYVVIGTRAQSDPCRSVRRKSE